MYQSELQTYRRDTARFRRHKYLTRCKRAGIQPRSRNAMIVSALLTTAITPLTVMAYA